MSASKGKRTGKQSKASRKQKQQQPAPRRTGRRSPKGYNQRLISAPSAFGTIDSGSAMQFREVPIKRHPILGISGIRVTGRQPLCQLNKTNGAVTTFQNPSGNSAGATPDDGKHLGAAVSGNYLEMNPMDLGGMLQRYGNLYQKFVFRNIRVVFTTRLGTNTNATNYEGEIAMGFSQDPGLGVASDPPNSFDDVRYLPDGITTVLWAPRAVVNYSYRGMETYFCQFVSSQYSSYTSEADKSAVDSMYRLASQCLFTGFWDVTPTASVLVGRLDLEYDIEFYSPNFGSIGLYTSGSLVRRDPVRLTRKDLGLKTEVKRERKRQEPPDDVEASSEVPPPLGGRYIELESEISLLERRIAQLKSEKPQ